MSRPIYPDLAAAVAIDGRPKYVIAAEARLVPQVLGGILSGRVAPLPEHRERLAAALGRSVDELFGTALTR